MTPGLTPGTTLGAVARSMLFVPATSERKIDKAFASPADARKGSGSPRDCLTAA